MKNERYKRSWSRVGIVGAGEIVVRAWKEIGKAEGDAVALMTMSNPKIEKRGEARFVFRAFVVFCIPAFSFGVGGGVEL